MDVKLLSSYEGQTTEPSANNCYYFYRCILMLSLRFRDSALSYTEKRYATLFFYLLPSRILNIIQNNVLYVVVVQRDVASVIDV